METKEINLHLENEMAGFNSLYGFVPDSALINSSLIQSKQEREPETTHITRLSVYYF